MVAAEDERQTTRLTRCAHKARDFLAEIEDLRQEPRTIVTDRHRLGDRCGDVAEIVDARAELLDELLLEARVTDRRRAHVDPAPARSEIERRADHGDFAWHLLHAHRRKANVPALMDQPDGPAATPARVLLVDDDATFLEALRPLIEQQPALTVVGAAHDGLAAIELADALLPDAVVIDLHMPIVDGVAAVARLRKDHPSLCLLALTGDPDLELHEAVTEAGADAVVLKEDLVGSLLERLAAVRDSAEPGRR